MGVRKNVNVFRQKGVDKISGKCYNNNRKKVREMNCYFCNFYIEDTCECELGYFNDSECAEWEEENV